MNKQKLGGRGNHRAWREMLGKMAGRAAGAGVWKERRALRQDHTANAPEPCCRAPAVLSQVHLP